MLDTFVGVLTANGLLTAFTLVGLIMAVSYVASARLSRNRLHGSAIAVLTGLVLAYIAGVWTGGDKGLADFPILAGVGLMGGAMFRDFAIIATAFGVDIDHVRRAGLAGGVALVVGVLSSFVVGVAIAWMFGYRDAVALTTIGAGAVTYIVGPVTGTAIGASSAVMALSIAAGLVKSILVMALTPFVAPYIGLDNPQSAVVYGGIMGTSSGVAAGLAATDPALVPYGAMAAAFYTGLGCLLGPSLLYIAVRALV